MQSCEKCGCSFTKVNSLHPQHCRKAARLQSEEKEISVRILKKFPPPPCHWHSYRIQRDTFLIQWAFSPSLSIKLSLTLSTGMILLRFFPQQLALLQRRAFTDEIEFADCRRFRTSVLLTFISFDVDIEVESKTHFGEISVEACFTRITFFVFQIFCPRLPSVLTSEIPKKNLRWRFQLSFQLVSSAFLVFLLLCTPAEGSQQKKLSEALFSIKHNEKLLKLIFIRSFSFPLLLRLLLLMVSLEKPTFIWLIFLSFSPCACFILSPPCRSTWLESPKWRGHVRARVAKQSVSKWLINRKKS